MQTMIARPFASNRGVLTYSNGRMEGVIGRKAGFNFGGVVGRQFGFNFGGVVGRRYGQDVGGIEEILEDILKKKTEIPDTAPFAIRIEKVVQRADAIFEKLGFSPPRALTTDGERTTQLGGIEPTGRPTPIPRSVAAGVVGLMTEDGVTRRIADLRATLGLPPAPGGAGFLPIDSDAVERLEKMEDRLPKFENMVDGLLIEFAKTPDQDPVKAVENLEAEAQSASTTNTVLAVGGGAVGLTLLGILTGVI